MKTFSSIHFISGFYAGKKTSTAYKVYSILSDILILTVVLTTLSQMFISPLDRIKESLSVSLIVLIAFSLALYYSLGFRFQHKKISKLVTLIEMTRLSLSETIGKTSMIEGLNRDLKQIKVFTHFGGFIAFISSFMFSVQPLLRSAALFGMDGGKELHIDIWCPFDYRSPFVFESIVALQFFTVFCVSIRFYANDTFYLLMIKMNVRFFKHLAAIGEGAMRPGVKQGLLVRNKKEMRGRLTLNLLQPILNGIKDHTNVNISFQEDFPSKCYPQFNKQAEERLKWFIKNHQLILRCCQLICLLYGPIMLMYSLTLMGFASVGAFGILHTNGLKVVQSVGVGLFGGTNLLYMFFLCRAGDELADMSSSVAMPIVASPWYQYTCSKKCCSSLALILQRVNTRVQASVIGLPTMPLNCSTFAWFTKTLVSFYLFLVQAKNT